MKKPEINQMSLRLLQIEANSNHKRKFNEQQDVGPY